MPCPGCARSLAGGGESRLGGWRRPPAGSPHLRGTGRITDAQWELFRGSGLTHIIAISGQHIALVAVLGWRLGRLFGLRGAICVSLLFAAHLQLAGGFAVATERALIMVLVWSLLRWLKRDWPSHRIWLWAFVVLTLWDPFAPLFCGVLALFWRWPCCCWRACCTIAPGLVRLQLLLLLGLLPLHAAAVRGDGAPGVSAQSAGTAAVLPCHHSLALIGVLVAPSPRCWPTACSGSPPSAWSGCCGAHAAGGSPAALVAGARLADARQRPADPAVGRDGTCREGAPWGPVAAALLLALWPAPASLAGAGAGRGAGLSVLVTRGIGPSCLIPGIATRGLQHGGCGHPALLNRLGIRVIDTLIISHRDRDHAGNRQALLQSMAVRRELSSFPWTGYPGLPPRSAVALAGTGCAGALAPGSRGRGATTTVAWCSWTTDVIGCC